VRNYKQSVIAASWHTSF